MHVLPDADAVFDGDVIADRDAALDERVIADVAVRADMDILQHMSKRPDARTFADCIGLDEGSFVDEWCFFHSVTVVEQDLQDVFRINM